MTAFQYYIADCVSWVPRLILLNLGTNWTYEHTLRMELVHMYRTYCNLPHARQQNLTLTLLKTFWKIKQFIWIKFRCNELGACSREYCFELSLLGSQCWQSKTCPGWTCLWKDASWDQFAWKAQCPGIFINDTSKFKEGESVKVGNHCQQWRLDAMLIQVAEMKFPMSIGTCLGKSKNMGALGHGLAADCV